MVEGAVILQLPNIQKSHEIAIYGFVCICNCSFRLVPVIMFMKQNKKKILFCISMLCRLACYLVEASLQVSGGI